MAFKAPEIDVTRLLCFDYERHGVLKMCSLGGNMVESVNLYVHGVVACFLLAHSWLLGKCQGTDPEAQ